MKGTPEERFWANIKKKRSGCWEWGMFKNDKGYGFFKVDGVTIRAHRYSWELHNGLIPEEMLVCHHCDNAACVRPSHLFLGSAQDNVDDMVNKGRSNKVSGEDHSKAKLTWSKVRFIRKTYKKHSFTKTQEQLAKRFEVTVATISDIILNKTWKE